METEEEISMKIKQERDYLTEDILMAELKELRAEGGEYDEENLVDSLQNLIQARKRLGFSNINYTVPTQRVFKELEQNGNPWGIHWGERDAWANGLGVPVAKDQDKVEVLYWVGCASSFKARSKNIARAVVAILQKAKVNFAILGAEEQCCGSFAKEVGNEHLFQVLASENIATLNSYNVKTIVTNCPHCHHFLKDEYPKLGGKFEVIHHTQYIDRLIRQGRVRLRAPITKETVYHDPCFLGSCSQVYQEPRAVLSAVPGLRLKESAQSGQKSFCCGGGGTRRILGGNLDDQRLLQMLGAGSNLITTSCPFCVNLFEAGALRQGQADVQVQDIAELVVQSI